MKDDFPAEWFPINRTVIFFLGANRFSPTSWAMRMRPTEEIVN